MEKPIVPEWYDKFDPEKPKQKLSPPIFHIRKEGINVSYHDLLLDNRRYKLVIDLETDWDPEDDFVYPIVSITIHNAEDPEFKRYEEDYLLRLKQYKERLEEYISIKDKLRQYKDYLADKKFIENQYNHYLSLKKKFEGTENGKTDQA
jgi:hypothetical protein